MSDNSWDEEFKIDFSHHCSSTCGCGQFQENDYPFIYILFVIRSSSKEHVWWWFEIFHWREIFIQECRKDLFNSSSLFSWREEYNQINHVESRLDKVKNTAKMNGLIWRVYNTLWLFSHWIVLFHPILLVNNTINWFSSFHHTIYLLCPNHQSNSHDYLIYNIVIWYILKWRKLG